MAENITIDVVVRGANARQEFKKTSQSANNFARSTTTASAQTTTALASLKSSAKSYLGAAGVAGIAGGTGVAVVSAFNRMQDKGAEFEQQLANLSAITGITGEALDELAEQALNDSTRYGEAASNIVEAQKLVASQLAEKIDFNTAEGLDQLKAVSEQAIVLQKAAGIDLRTAVGATTKAINQFNRPAEDAGEIINVLAAGAKRGAGEVDFLSQALEEAGIGAAGANESINTTVAALEILAKNGIDAAKAGTGLRNIFTILQGETQKLAQQGIHNLNIEQDGLIESLRKAKPLLDDAAGLNKVFGREVANTARALLTNVDSIEKMRSQISGTNTAYEQAETQINTYQGAVNQLSATYDQELIRAFRESNGVMVESINLLTDLVEVTGDVVRQMNDYVESELEVKDQLGTINYLWQQHFGIFADATNALGLTDAEEKTRQWIKTQQQATQATADKVRMLETDIKTYKEGAQAAEDNSEKQAAYMRQLGNVAGQLGVMRGELEAQKAQLQSAMESTEKGSTEYERYEFALEEVNERLQEVKDAQDKLSATEEESGKTTKTKAEQTKNLTEKIESLEKANKKLINQSEPLTDTQIEELQNNQQLIEKYQQLINKRQKLASYEPADMATDFSVENIETPDIDSILPDEEVGSKQLKLPKVDTVEYEVALTRAAELRQQLAQENQRAANAETAAEQHAARQSIQSIRQQIRWEENKAQVVAGATAQISGALADMLKSMNASSEAVKAAALVEVAANSARAVSAAVAQAAAIPFPANLGAIASAVAAVMSGVTQAYTLLNKSPDKSGSGKEQQRGSGRAAGFASGGQVPVAVSNGEYQVSPQNAQRNLPLLNAINANPDTAKTLANAAVEQSRSGGGVIRGPGTGTSDSIKKSVEAGTFIVNAKSTQEAKPILDVIEKGDTYNSYRYGGPVNEQQYKYVNNHYRQKSAAGGIVERTWDYSEQKFATDVIENGDSYHSYNYGGPVHEQHHRYVINHNRQQAATGGIIREIRDQSNDSPILNVIESRKYADGGQVAGNANVIQQINQDQSRVVEAINNQTMRLEQVERRVQLSLNELEYKNRLYDQNESLQ